MSKKPVLVVMAAGMGSRYGGLKQIDPVGSHGEAILDYSLFDAYEAGFRTAVIIIKEAIKADFMDIDLNTNNVLAYGRPDSVDGKPSKTHPVFSEGGSSYTMDTITYNFGSKKAFIQGVATKEGDGWLVGGQIKKMPDNSIPQEKLLNLW